MLIDDLERIVGPKAVKTDSRDVEKHVTEWRGMWRGRAAAVVLPENTDQVSRLLQYCNAAGVGVVPQGGNTGLCAGGIPDDSGSQIVLSTARLNRIRAINSDDFSMVAEAGCVLATLQEAARDVDRLFPLSLGAEGSCQIGGNLSTNAGGINVVRYGTARDQVLGLEVVLADGRILEGLKTLRKNTAGYDLKQLFIGSEGTLGVITAASLKLYPAPARQQTAFLALEDARHAVAILARLRSALGENIQAFELIASLALEFVERHIESAESPFEKSWPWYVLLETSVDDASRLERALMSILEAGLAGDIVLAKSNAEAARLWRMRHSISEAEKSEAPILKHDVSVPVGSVPGFLSATMREHAERWPETRLFAFGHVGDGNLHYNVSLPKAWSEEQVRIRGEAITHWLYERVASWDGSFSAEHGVGRAKKAALQEFADPVALELMRTLKKALDPNGILNPGKVI